MSDVESPEVPVAEPLTAASIRQLIREELAAAGRSAETPRPAGDPTPSASVPDTPPHSGKFSSIYRLSDRAHSYLAERTAGGSNSGGATALALALAPPPAIYLANRAASSSGLATARSLLWLGRHQRLPGQPRRQ